MNKIYDQWIQACVDLRKAKATELELRNIICETHLTDKLEGSKTIREEGYAVTPTAKLNRSLNKEVLDVLWDDLTVEERACIVYKPSLVLANYKKIENSDSKLIEAVTCKPGQSSLKIIMEDLA